MSLCTFLLVGKSLSLLRPVHRLAVVIRNTPAPHLRAGRVVRPYAQPGSWCDQDDVGIVPYGVPTDSRV